MDFCAVCGSPCLDYTVAARCLRPLKVLHVRQHRLKGTTKIWNAILILAMDFLLIGLLNVACGQLSSRSKTVIRRLVTFFLMI